MTTIKALSYVRVTGADLEAWDRYATEVLGLAPIRDGERLTLRLDERNYRFDIRTDGPAETVMGWDVATKADLETLATALDKAGIGFTVGDAETLADRDVLAQITFSDPYGLKHEAVVGARLGLRPVHFSRKLSAYTTGQLGLGHFAVGVPDLEAATEFYSTVLGFRLTDAMPGLFSFMRVNPRHHSIALMQHDTAEIHHMLLQVDELEDVGRAYDAATSNGSLRKSLGQHTNDGLVSFYTETPAGWEVELGTGGMEIDDDTWIVRQVGRPFSACGHKALTS